MLHLYTSNVILDCTIFLPAAPLYHGRTVCNQIDCYLVITIYIDGFSNFGMRFFAVPSLTATRIQIIFGFFFLGGCLHEN